MTPLFAPLRRLRDSAAYRSAFGYRGVLRLLPLRWPEEKPPLLLTFLTFGGAAHREMLRECLLSLACSWPRLPRIRVISDGSLQPDAVLRDLRGFRGELEILDWRDPLEWLAAPRFAPLVRFAEREAMGRKMAAAVASALAGPTLYCDVDVLWYRYPATLEELLTHPGSQLALSPDCRASYDPGLVPGILPELALPPHFCAGLLYAEGDFLACCDVWDLLQYAELRGTGVTEQTILAEADRQLGGRTWPAQEIALDEGDRTSFAPSFRGRPWAARHYVGAVRHLFWRDALALRLGWRP